jgi:hypothetical protein
LAKVGTLAIVGSCSLAGNAEATRIIARLFDEYQPTRFVSGGAVGIDTMAREEAKRRGIRCRTFRPDVQRWDPPGAYGFKARNIDIAEACDRLVRIVAIGSKTYGSGWTRDYAKRLGKPTEEYWVEG